MDLSIIYPVHITYRTKYILNRLEQTLSNVGTGLPMAEHVVVLSGSRWYVKKALRILASLKSQLDLKILLDFQPSIPYSPGIARNHAVRQCHKDHLLFWDVDLLGSPNLFEAIPSHLKKIKAEPKCFHMYPCLYLCKEYSNQFSGDFDKAWNDATSLKLNSIEHFAMATSTILCSKEHFLKLGAFDEDFIGHMGEDLELLSRLYLADGKYPVNIDYPIDHPSKIPSEQKGFRRHFLYYSVEPLRLKQYTVHLYHSTGVGGNYKSNNRLNRSLLKAKIVESLQKHQSYISNTYLELPNYLNLPPKITRNNLDKLKRKSKKLIKTPIQFFKDI